MKDFHLHQTVAVLPLAAHAASDALCLTKVAHVGHCLVRTVDGQLYSAAGGIAIQGHDKIVPARLHHWLALGLKRLILRISTRCWKG